jgi:hypothetical protein
MSAYIKRTEVSQINDLTLHLKLLENQEQAKLQTSRRREIINIRAQNNEIETKKKKNQNFQKLNKIDRTLANLTKMRREKTQTSKIRMKNER